MCHEIRLLNMVFGKGNGHTISYEIYDRMAFTSGLAPKDVYNARPEESQ